MSKYIFIKQLPLKPHIGNLHFNNEVSIGAVVEIIPPGKENTCYQSHEGQYALTPGEMLTCFRELK